MKSFPKRSVADLYAFISFHQWEKGSIRKYGRGIDKLLSKDMEDFREKMSGKKEIEYPEMVREITAFVLMNVSGKREDRIIEKLYDLKEVREIHSVHGDVDVLIKIVLTRDLVSSDAEMIGQFVHNQVRQIPGSDQHPDPDPQHVQDQERLAGEKKTLTLRTQSGFLAFACDWNRAKGEMK